MKTVIGALLALCPFTCGCVFMGGGDEVIFDEALRYQVQFESIAASKDFYEGLEASDRENFTEDSVFVIPGLAACGGDIFYETEHYNAQVRMSDMDRDDVITDEEAQLYRERVLNSLD